MKDQVNRNLDFLVVPVKCEISFVSDHFGVGVYNKKTNKPDTKGKNILASELIARGLVDGLID